MKLVRMTRDGACRRDHASIGVWLAAVTLGSAAGCSEATAPPLESAHRLMVMSMRGIKRGVHPTTNGAVRSMPAARGMVPLARGNSAPQASQQRGRLTPKSVLHTRHTRCRDLRSLEVRGKQASRVPVGDVVAILSRLRDLAACDLDGGLWSTQLPRF